MMGSQLPDIATGVESGMYRYPLGVVGGIAPFNFPMMVPCWMFPLAVACGNTFVLKPSERTPLLVNRLAELFAEAGFPPGVLNVVHGAHEVVDGLLAHEEVKAVSFVGSQPVAEYVYKQGTAHGKRVQALAGAKNHSIVLKDADLDHAVKNILSAAFGSAGERCMACAVVVVQEDIADELVSRITEAADGLKIGNGKEEGCSWAQSSGRRTKTGRSITLKLGLPRRRCWCGMAARMLQLRATAISWARRSSIMCSRA